jgi:integrase
MTTALTTTQPAPLAALQDVTDRARFYAEQSRAESTRRAYQRDWADFVKWCAHPKRNFIPLPADPATVALYITNLAHPDKGENEPAQKPHKVATIERRLVAISQAHKLAGYERPTCSEMVRSVLKGIRRTEGTAQVAKAPATTDVLRRMLDTLPASILGTRDRALLLIGFAGAFRRSELVSLNVADVQFTTAGAVVTLRRSKTDQEGQGTKKGIPFGTSAATCPVRALKAWLDASGISEGPIFRPINRHGQVRGQRLTAHSVARVVKRYADAAGLPIADFSGHSLRAGLATSAAAAGASERAIMQQTGHKSERMVRRYIRDGQLFRDNAAAVVGL